MRVWVGAGARVGASMRVRAGRLHRFGHVRVRVRVRLRIRVGYIYILWIHVYTYEHVRTLGAIYICIYVSYRLHRFGHVLVGVREEAPDRRGRLARVPAAAWLGLGLGLGLGLEG